MENKAKEKAEELIKKFKHVTMSWNIQEECYDASLEDQVKAAIIAVEEIITAIDWHSFEAPNKELVFWQEVKEHLNAMK